LLKHRVHRLDAVDESVGDVVDAVDAPKGIGTLTSYATEVALPVKGTWKNPAVG
jgi:hypothetical protein